MQKALKVNIIKSVPTVTRERSIHGVKLRINPKSLSDLPLVAASEALRQRKTG